MKKTLKNWLLPVVVAASAVFGWSFFGGTSELELIVTEQPQNLGYGATFTLNNLPVIADADGSEQFLVFVSTSDGNYFMDTISYSSTTASHSATLDKVYHYAVEKEYSPYAEITVAYDDGNPPPPKRAAIPNGGTFTPTLGSSVSNALIFNGWAKISANRRIVEGDSITYIVTYQNRSGCNTEVHGEIVLQFDTSKLEYKGAELFFDEYPSGTLQANQTGKLRYTYLSLDSAEQRNAFFVFKAKKNNSIETGDTLNPIPTLTLTHGNDISSSPSISPCANDSVSIVHEGSRYISAAHDPNGKTANLRSICQKDGYIEYTIRFQNEGNAPTDSVTITDVLSDIFPAKTEVKMTGWYPTAPVHTSPSSNKHRFVFEGNTFSLRGLGEPDYGTKFGEEATYGYVKFKAKLPVFTLRLHCQMLPNQANIIFGCNPPIPTNTSFTPFGCGTDCTDCKTTVNVTLPTLKPAGTVGSPVGVNTFMNGELQNQIKGKFTRFRWYPSIETETDAVLLPPIQVRLRNNIYTLIASNADSCTRGIYRIPVEFPSCTLTINVDPAGLQPTACVDSKTGYIHASVQGGTPPYTWHNCQNGTQYSEEKLQSGKYYLGVTDKNGCTGEHWVNILPATAPLFVDDDPNDCQVNLRVSGGTPPYTYAWEFDGKPQPTFTNSNLDPGIKTGVRVTVTDNGSPKCSVVFSPKLSGNCSGTSDGPGIGTALWVLLGLLFSGVLLRFFLVRKNKV